jgi:hypothetical protein
MDLTALDLQQARIKQVLFKSRLRSVLYGVREADEALFSRSENPLGQWLDAVVKPQMGHHPEVRQVDRLLSQIITIARDLATQYQRGRIEEARAGLDQVNTLSDQITDLFEQLGKRLFSA